MVIGWNACRGKDNILTVLLYCYIHAIKRNVVVDGVIVSINFYNSFPVSPLPTTCNFYYQHDFITLFRNSPAGIFSVCAPLYLQGRSLKEIVALTGFPYSTIRSQLVAGGLTLRTNKSVSSIKILRQRFKNSTPPPYGYCYMDGRLQADPREYPILQIIAQQRKLGRSPTAIAQYLNERKFKSRKGGAWKQPTVYYIVQRLESQTTEVQS